VSGSDWGKKWGKKKIQGVEYDLGHLDPFVFEAIPGSAAAARILVGVSFSLHTFTRDREAGDAPDTLMVRNNDSRSFCTHRYKCSQHLPQIVRGIAAGAACISHSGNYMIVSAIDCAAGEYATLFQLWKSSSEKIPVRMGIISAHERTGALPNMKEISFYTLVRKIAQG
jgi:hypothetical protein